MWRRLSRSLYRVCDSDVRDVALRVSTRCFLLPLSHHPSQAWELKSLNRSLFRIRPDRPFYVDLWENKVLFWAVTLGMASVPLAIYIPGLNEDVFFQQGITWEWGLVVGMTVVFVSCVELWKALVTSKRMEGLVGQATTVKEAEV